VCLELHHVAGRSFDDEVVVLCSNHHDDCSDRAKDHPEHVPGSDVSIELIAHSQSGLIDILCVTIEQFEHSGVEASRLRALRYVAGKLKATTATAYMLIGAKLPDGYWS
jgi:hypothetical protein